MTDKLHAKKALILTGLASVLALIVSYLLSLPARTTDIFGHSHTPAGFEWSIYIFASLALVSVGTYAILEISERLK